LTHRFQGIACQDRADTRGLYPPGGGAGLLTSMWLMLPAAPMVKIVSMLGFYRHVLS
jgi:hypothetical protein